MSRQLLVSFDKTNRIEGNTDSSTVNNSTGRTEESEILIVLRILLNVAIEINSPDVFYVLAISSIFASNQFWSSPWCRERFQGIHLMGNLWWEISQLRGALNLHVRKVLPIFVVARYDPDANTSAIVNKLWASLTSGNDCFSSSAHFLPLVDRLMESTASKVWKIRVGSCRALSEIIMGKNWEVSATIISYGLPILAKKQLWTGKEELVKAIVGIFTRWLTDSWNILVEKNSFHDTKWPISSKIGSWVDLLDGDQRFQRQSSPQDKEEHKVLDHQGDCLQSSDNEEEEEEEAARSDVLHMREINSKRAKFPAGTATFAGILHCLLDQATLSPNSMVLGLSESELLPYKAVVLESLTSLMDTLQTKMHSSMITKDLHIRLYEGLHFYLVESTARNSTPLLVARSISCIASSLWYGIDDFSEVFTHFHRETKNAAWTVRESSLLAMNRLVQRATITAVRKVEFLECILSVSFEASKEKKFYRIRLAGMSKLFICSIYSSVQISCD